MKMSWKTFFLIVVGLALNSFVFSIIADRVWHCSATRLSSTFRFGSRELFFSVSRLLVNVFSPATTRKEVSRRKNLQSCFETIATSWNQFVARTWKFMNQIPNCSFLLVLANFSFHLDHTKLFLYHSAISLSTEENTRKNFAESPTYCLRFFGQEGRIHNYI